MSKTLIDLIDAVSYKINGKPADTISRPTKPEIALAINETEKQMVIDRPQYNFLRKTATIDVWKPGLGSVSKFPGTPTGNPTQPVANNDSVLVAGTEYTQYFAEGYTQGTVQPATISNFKFYVNPYTGLGATTMNGYFKAYIVAPAFINPGDATSNPLIPTDSPDINHILATSSTTITIVNDAGTDAQGNTYDFSGSVAMTFEFDDTFCIGTGQKVYMVVEWHATAYNGRTFSTFRTVGGPSNDSWIILETGIPQATYPGGIGGGIAGPALGSLFFWLTIKNAVYNYKDVSLPSDCRMPIRIGLPGSNFLFLPVGTDQAMFKQFSCPLATFYESGLDTDGNKTVTFNLQYDYNVQSQPTMMNFIIPSAPYLLIDYIASAGSMVNDTDVPIVPQDFVEALVYGALVALYSDNNGLPYSPATYEKKYELVLNKMNMIVLPQRSVAVQVNTGSYTSTMAAVRGSVNTNSLYTAYWPNSWSHIYFSSLGHGVTSQG